MKLGKGLTFSGGDDKKKNTILAVILVVVIVGAGWLFVRNFIGGGAPTTATNTTARPPEMPPPGAGPPGSLPPGEVPPGEIAPSGPHSSSQGPAGPPGASSPAAQPPVAQPRGAGARIAPGAPRQQAPSAQEPTASSRAVTGEMRQVRVFGSVTVRYPSGWKIKAGGGNTFAVFTDGNALFTVHAPDPKADSAMKIAQAAIKALTPGAIVTGQGTDKVSGYEAQWFAVRYKGKLARVVGIDAPTRIAVVETVKSGDFARYRDTFNQMQSAISF